jgi:hypothetical protein
MFMEKIQESKQVNDGAAEQDLKLLASEDEMMS